MEQEQAAGLEQACADAEQRVEIALRTSVKLSGNLKAARKALTLGDVGSLRKSLRDVGEMLQVLRADAQSVAQSWPYDEASEQALFEEGGYKAELLAAAERAGLMMAEEDGMLMCYPSLVRVDPVRRILLIDKKPYRNVRPSVVVAFLKAQQTRPPRFKPAQFLESLYAAWDYARHARAGHRPPAVDVKVDHIYAVLTVAPGSAKEYSKPEFGRDLYLLERSGEAVTRKGARVHFSRSTGAKASGVITVMGEDGQRVAYSSVSFREA